MREFTSAFSDLVDDEGEGVKIPKIVRAQFSALTEELRRVAEENLSLADEKALLSKFWSGGHTYRVVHHIYIKLSTCATV